MSLLDQFKNELPLTPCKLIEWICILLQKVECANMAYETFEAIYAVNRGTNITNILTVDKFDSIHEAIKAGQKIEISGPGNYLTVISASTFDVESDDFYSFSFTVIDSELQCISLCISKMMGVLYLDSKSTTAIGN